MPSKVSGTLEHPPSLPWFLLILIVFSEGPEKLLEVWFAPSAKALPASAKENGLKAVSPAEWEGMLDLVYCKVLSIVNSEEVDAYLLSESSMFVFPHKIILKTCGTTTLLLGLHRLLRIAAVHAGFPFHNAKCLDDIHAAATPYRVFYSRKSFLFPDKQRGPHRSWKQEVKYLDDMFEGGSAYMVGKMNGDHWYLYITSPSNMLTPPRTPEEKKNGSPTRTKKIPTGLMGHLTSATEDTQDETLEILMTDLDPENAKQFYLSHASAVANEQVPAQIQEARQDAHGSLGVLSNGTAAGSDAGPAESTHDATFDVFNNCGELDLAGGAPTPATDPAAAECLTTEGHALGTVVSNSCGLSDVYPTSIYPDARIDAYLFSPCGFSANGVIPAALPPSADENSAPKIDGSDSKVAAHYFTVHVTPEPHCSFASFETNMPGGKQHKGRETAEVVEHVVRIFKPGRLSVTLFEAKGKKAEPAAHDQPLVDNVDKVRSGYGTDTGKPRMERIQGYRRIDRIVHDFEDYDLVFRYYEREGWVGDGGARVGEEM